MNETLYLAGGCFWGIEAYFKRLPGVVHTTVGYANSRIESPSYEQVCTGETHASECVRIEYDPTRISAANLVEALFAVIDTTAENRQGNDVGTQYRSGIYYESDELREALWPVFNREALRVGKAFAVELLPLSNFYDAETYHQDYLDKHPNGYCHINPLAADRFARAHGLVASYESLNAERYQVKSADDIKHEAGEMAYAVTQRSATEPPFSHEYDREFTPGIYVDITSGEPLFVSSDKFNAGCGWPAFSQPIDPEVINEQVDYSHGMVRVEVRSRVGNAHLGHVFEDGPLAQGGRRYCINGSALRFIPKDQMEDEGYGDLIDRVQ